MALSRAAVILMAATGLSVAAFIAGSANTDQIKCEQPRTVVKYFAVPEPIPLIPTPSWTWPLRERLDRIDSDAPAPAPQSAKDVAEDDPPEHVRHIRHRRHHYWRWR